MEQALLNVAQIFTGEINKLEANKNGANPEITLKVKFERYTADKRPKIELTCGFYDGSEYHNCKGASLGAIMDEVYRRAGFADREALHLDRVEASLVALPSPKLAEPDKNDEIPF